MIIQNNINNNRLPIMEYVYIFLSSCFCTFLCYITYILTRKGKNNMPPLVPWQGKFHHIHPFWLLYQDPNSALHRFSEQCGPIFQISFKPFKSYIFIADEEYAHQYYHTTNRILNLPNALSSIIPKTMIGGKESFSNDAWRDAKQLVREVLWKGSKLLGGPCRQWMSATNADILSCYVNKKVEVFELARKLIFAMNIRIVFGHNFYKEHCDKLTRFLSTYQTASVHPLTLVAPWLPFGVPKIATDNGKQCRNLIAEEVRRRIDNCIKQNQPVHKVLDGAPTTEEQDYLFYIINKYYSGETQSKLEPDSKLFNFLVNHVSNTLGASQINSIHVLGWTIYSLLKNPELIKTIREEKNEEYLFKFTEACIYETVRIYGNFFTTRRTEEDYKIETKNGTTFIIPKGHCILFGHNYCINASRNIPWDPIASMQNDKNQRCGKSFEPFGVGQHPCLGQYLVIHEILQASIDLFRNYDITLENRCEKLSWKNSAVNPHPQNPIYISIKPRKH